MARVAKYIPGETVAFFVAIKSFVEAPNPAPDTAAFWINLSFVVGLLGTPVYLWLQREKGQPWIVNTILATVAFPIWVAALGCKFGWPAVVPAFNAGILLLIYTYIAGMFKPVK